MDEYDTPEALADDWLRGGLGMATIKLLEMVYGPSGPVRGSWRTSETGNKKNRAFSKREPAFQLVEKLGEAAALAAMHVLLDGFTGTAPRSSWTAMQHALSELCSQQPGAQKRQAEAVNRATKLKRLSIRQNPVNDPP